MTEIVQNFQRFGDYGVGLFTLNIGNHADAAGVVLLFGSV